MFYVFFGLLTSSAEEVDRPCTVKVDFTVPKTKSSGEVWDASGPPDPLVCVSRKNKHGNEVFDRCEESSDTWKGSGSGHLQESDLGFWITVQDKDLMDNDFVGKFYCAKTKKEGCFYSCERESGEDWLGKVIWIGNPEFQKENLKDNPVLLEAVLQSNPWVNPWPKD